MIRRCVLALVAALWPLAAPAADGALAQRKVFPAMTFALATNDRADPRLGRWIIAAGEIQRDTDKVFAAFVKKHGVEDWPVVLDSNGGNLGASLRLGRHFRRHNLTVLVGQTVRDPNGRPRITQNGAVCASGCVYALMGGTKRMIVGDQYVKVHQFGRDGKAKANGQGQASDYGPEAQSITATIAVYMQEMGIDMRLLEWTMSAPFKGEPRTLTRAEITGSRLAVMTNLRDPDDYRAEWARYTGPDEPEMMKAQVVESRPGRRIDEDLTVTCSDYRGFMLVRYRQTLVRRSEEEPVGRFVRVRLSTPEEDYIFRHNDRPFSIRKPGDDAWMRRNVPASLLESAARTGRLEVQTETGSGFGAPRSILDDGFAEQYRAMARTCAGRSKNYAIGYHPLR